MTHCHAVRPEAVPKNAVAFFPQLSCDQGQVYMLSPGQEANFKRMFNPVTWQPTLEGNGFVLPCHAASWCIGARKVLGGSIISPVRGAPSGLSRPTTIDLVAALARFTNAKQVHLTQREIVCIASLIEASPMSDHALRMVASTGTYAGAPLDSLTSTQVSAFINGMMHCM